MTTSKRNGARFRKVCVIGAGVMGQGIASHLANARVPVLLLDIVPPKFTDADKAAGLTEDSKAFRNKFAAGGLKRALKAKPANFLDKKDAGLIEVGNLEDDLDKLAECDWVIEVVIENLAIKQNLFEKLEGAITEGTVVSSNTSGLSIEGMLEGRSDSFKKNFLVTHFFNPVRYLPLLEIVAGKDTDADVLARVTKFGEDVLGKGIVVGKDTPNFVANRIGVFGMMDTMRVMLEDGYTIEEVDAVFGPTLGRAKSAVFRTADVVGLDTFVHVAQNCWDNLGHDERHDVFKTPEFLAKMVENGWLGQKSKQGFYKKDGKTILALNVNTMEYAPKEKVRFDSLGAARHLESLEERVKTVAWADDRGGQLAWKVLASTCIYAANRFGEIADDLVSIDNGMKWGFNWEMGPFATWDALGVTESVERMEKEGLAVPAWVKDMLGAGRTSFFATDDAGVTTVWNPTTKTADVLDEGEKVMPIARIKANKSNIVSENTDAALIDLGDGVLGVEFHTKMNALGPDIVKSIGEALDRAEGGEFDAIVIGNDGPNFSAGANLLLIYMAAQQQAWDQIDEMIRTFQTTFQRLKYSSVPTVAAPFGLTLGGGAEVAMWCDRIQAHAELYMGLVEVGVGLIPGAGGTVEMTARTLQNSINSPTAPKEQLLQRALETVAMAKVATSAEEARGHLFLSQADGVTLNRRHQLFAAKQVALGMAKAGYRPPQKRTYRLPGKSAMATFDMALSTMRDGHYISDHDLLIAKKVAHVMTGGDTSSRVELTEERMLELEREAFLSLCGEEKSQARIAHMLQKNKPLRN